MASTNKTAANYLPSNPQAEQAVLGSAFLSRDALYTIVSELDADDFFEARNQILFKVLKTLTERKISVDVLTVTEELVNLKVLDEIGGVEYLKQCSDAMVALSSLNFYITIVKDQSVLRHMLTTIREIDHAYLTSEIENINDFIADGEQKFKDSTEKRRVSTFKNMEEIAKSVQMSINAQHGNYEDGVTGVTTGYANINKYTAGFQKGELTIIAARPSVGKTALALNFAYKVATRANVPVAIFSLEMSSELLVKRLVAAAASIPLDRINTGVLSAVDRAELSNAIREVSTVPIFIDDSSSIRLMDIVAKSRQLQAKYPNLGLIIVDYLGLVTTGEKSKNSDSRQEEVRKISLTLKALAKDLKVPVIAVSQLSRDVEKRDNKRPVISDLRDSGSIEQDADVVMLMYREDYYALYKKENTRSSNKQMKDMTPSEKFEAAKAAQLKQMNESIPGNASYVEVNIAKNRNGQTGIAGLFFFKSFGRFEAPTAEWEAQMRSLASSDID